MPIVEDIEEIAEIIRYDILEDARVQSAVINTIKGFMGFQIEETVYDAYSPKLYERRGRLGGFDDPRNINVEGEGNRSEIVYIFENVTVGNEDVGDLAGMRIDSTIEYGTGYTWGEHPDARPVIRNTKMDLIYYRDEIIEILKESSDFFI